VTASLNYLSPHYRNHPDAEAFCEVLVLHLPEWAEELDDYAWDTAIPPREQWEREAEELARHLETL
jgi:hypothetical protein